MAFLIVDPNIVILNNTVGRLSASIKDSDGNLADPAELQLDVMDISGSNVASDTWPSPDYRIVRTGIGTFYMDFGYAQSTLSAPALAGATTISISNAQPLEGNGWPTDFTVLIDKGTSVEETVSVVSNTITAGTGTITLLTPLQYAHSSGAKVFSNNIETNSPQELLANWRITMASGDEQLNSMQKIKVISAKFAMFLPDLRLLIDKSRKLTSPQSECFIGYSEANLVQFLQGGLENINAYQPSLNFTIENYPMEYREILIESALISGVISQQLYSIDTDLQSYSDQGTSYVLSHQPQLASFLNQITQRLDKLIPMMKLQLLNPGSMHSRMGPDFRLNTLVSGSPSGSLFRNFYFRG